MFGIPSFLNPTQFLSFTIDKGVVERRNSAEIQDNVIRNFVNVKDLKFYAEIVRSGNTVLILK